MAQTSRYYSSSLLILIGRIFGEAVRAMRLASVTCAARSEKRFVGGVVGDGEQRGGIDAGHPHWTCWRRTARAVGVIGCTASSCATLPRWLTRRDLHVAIGGDGALSESDDVGAQLV